MLESLGQLIHLVFPKAWIAAKFDLHKIGCNVAFGSSPMHTLRVTPEEQGGHRGRVLELLIAFIQLVRCRL